MYKISLLLLVISSPIYAMFGGSICKGVSVLRCALRFSHAAPTHSSILMQSRPVASDNSSLSEYIEPARNEFKKMRPEILTLLKDGKIYSPGGWVKNFSWPEERKRIAVAAHLLGRDYAQHFFERALDYKDHELVEQLLSFNIVVKDIHTKEALACDDIRMLTLLLARIRKPAYPINHFNPSLNAIKLFLQHGADVATIEGRWRGSLRSPVGGLDSVGRVFKGYQQNRQLSEDQIDYLKKVIVLTRAGDPLTFPVGNPLSRDMAMQKYGTWTDTINCRSADGDWTFGIFTDLADYTHAVVKSRLKIPEIKADGMQKMAVIMHKWGITEEDVAIMPPVEAGSSRVQEAD